MDGLTHIGEDGYAKMVGVGDKEVTRRDAEASGVITMNPETLKRIKEGGIKKGDVLSVAEVAGIMAAKKTAELVPLAHNIPLEGCEIAFEYPDDKSIKVRAKVAATAKTGAEMEAITAVSLTLITVYDMAKAIDRGMVIGDIRLEYKNGGKSGTYRREDK